MLLPAPSDLREGRVMNKRQREKALRRAIDRKAWMLLRYIVTSDPRRSLSTAYEIAFMADMAYFRVEGRPISGVLWRKTPRGPRPGGYFWTAR